MSWRAGVTRWGIALLLAAVTFAAIAAAQRREGVARDEVVYVTYAHKYAAWWRDLVTGKPGTLSVRGITSHFGGPLATSNNREHPPLMKTLFGLSEMLFHDHLHWTSRLTASRLPAAATFGLLVALVFLFVDELWGRPQALIAALLTLLMPRMFFHAGLACFDVPVAAMWFATLYAYHRALKSRRWCVGLGVVYGLALATKEAAMFMPAVIFVHYAWVAARSQPEARSGPVPARLRAAMRGAWRTRPLAIACMMLLGPLVLVAVWPWLWFHPIGHVAAWLRFHLHHVNYNYEYLGKNYNHPPFPWHVPFVTTALTVPVVTLVAALFGAAVVVVRARRGRGADPERAPALLLFLSAGVAIGPFMLGHVPIFGASKHWLAAMATLAIYAGIGIVEAAAAAARALPETWRGGQRLWRWGLIGVIGGAAIAAALVETVDAQPYALTHYNALAGGAPGGADLGMNRQFWGVSARGVLPFLNAHAPRPGQPPVPVYTHDASPAWPIYRREGLLAPGLPDAGHELFGIHRSKLAIVIHELHFNRHDYFIWRDYGTVQPVYVLTTDGVPIVSVYERPPPASTSKTRPR